MAAPAVEEPVAELLVEAVVDVGVVAAELLEVVLAAELLATVVCEVLIVVDVDKVLEVLGGVVVELDNTA